MITKEELKVILTFSLVIGFCGALLWAIVELAIWKWKHWK